MLGCVHTESGNKPPGPIKREEFGLAEELMVSQLRKTFFPKRIYFVG